MALSRYHPLELASRRLAQFEQGLEASRRARLALDAPLAVSGDNVFVRSQAHLASVQHRRGRVKVRMYAHERLVFTVAEDEQGFGKRATKYMRAMRSGGGPSNLVIRRESQPCLKIGGQWLSIPLKTKFTTSAKNTLRDAVHILETSCEGVGLFLTLTIAGGTDEVFRAISIASGYLVNRFNNFLRRTASVESFGYCWEIQGRGAPHLHYVFRMPQSAITAGFYRLVRQQWRRILLDASAEAGVDLFARSGGGTWRGDVNAPRVNFKVVRVGLGKYVSKYISKCKSKSGGATGWHPGRWTGVSYALRKRVQGARLDLQLTVPTLEAARLYVSAIAEKLDSFGLQCWRPSVDLGTSLSVMSVQAPPGYGRRLFEYVIRYFSRGSSICPRVPMVCV